MNNHGTPRTYLLDRETPPFYCRRAAFWWIGGAATSWCVCCDSPAVCVFAFAFALPARAVFAFAFAFALVARAVLECSRPCSRSQPISTISI